MLKHKYFTINMPGAKKSKQKLELHRSLLGGTHAHYFKAFSA